MNKTNHTPGPWTANEVTGLVNPANNPDKDIAHVFGQRNLGECEANARLIAAAPDLLVVLQKLLRDADAEPNGEYLDGAGKNRVAVHRKVIEQARAAIDKATAQ